MTSSFPAMNRIDTNHDSGCLKHGFGRISRRLERRKELAPPAGLNSFLDLVRRLELLFQFGKFASIESPWRGIVFIPAAVARACGPSGHVLLITIIAGQNLLKHQIDAACLPSLMLAGLVHVAANRGNHLWRGQTVAVVFVLVRMKPVRII